MSYAVHLAPELERLPLPRRRQILAALADIAATADRDSLPPALHRSMESSLLQLDLFGDRIVYRLESRSRRLVVLAVYPGGSARDRERSLARVRRLTGSSGSR